MTDLDPFAPFSAANAEHAPPEFTSPPTDEWTCLSPVPEEAFPIDVALGGKPPKSTWLYHDRDKHVLGVACRWDTDTGKDFRFATWCRNEAGRARWRLKHLPSPRPIFGLDRLAASPLAPVIVCEGEKKCAPAVKHFPDHVAIAWPGGANAAHLVDWSPLKGRTVFAWPDNDDAGRKAAAVVAEKALAAGADSALVVPVPHEFPVKWDLADRVPDGADLHALLEVARPSKRPEPIYPAGFRMLARGLVWSDPSDDEKPEVVVSGRFDVVAESRDDAGWAWGVLLRWQDPDGRSREWAMPRSILASDGVEVRRALLDGGLYVGAGTKARNLLTTFLTAVRVEERAKAVTTTGWHDGAFVLPDGAIGKSKGERVILQTAGGVDHAYNVKGDLASWQETVARYAAVNSRLVLAISTAFASALVGPCGAESGGIHLRGRSSIGKSTALAVAGSVWGGGDRGFVRAWRATSNGLEAAAGCHNDALLCLDELAQLSGREAGEVAYMLANGSGKSRASRDALLRKPARWRLLFLSSGEISLADKIAEDVRGRRQTAGQQVRVVDVPADTGSAHGLFETLHGFDDAGALAKHLVAASRDHYGTAARAFIEKLAPDLEEVRAAANQGVQDFIADVCPADADGQVKRVAGRFGLIAVAGEIATTLGIVPWQPGEALRAAGTCFSAWIDARGGVEPAEVRDGIAAVRTFLSAHGSSRFLSAWEDESSELRIVNLAGFRKQVTGADGSAWDYYVTTEAWPEVAAGFDAKSLASTLAERGLLVAPDKGSHRAKFMRVPAHGSRRLYHLSHTLLEGEHA